MKLKHITNFRKSHFYVLEKRIHTSSKNIIKFYRRKIEIMSKPNFCFNFIVLIEELNNYKREWIQNIFLI